MAVLGGASLAVYTVVAPPAPDLGVATSGWVPAADDEGGRRKRAQAAADKARAHVPSDVLDGVEVLDGDVARALAATSTGLDLLVCGTRGHGPLHTAVFRGVAGTLAHSCACPLIVLPRQHRRADHAGRETTASPAC